MSSFRHFLKTRWPVTRAALWCCAVIVLAPAAGRSQQINVGKNVQVSGARSGVAHTEVLLAADPNDASRLLAVSIVIFGPESKIRTVVYASRDGGRSWAETLYTGEAADLSGDPSVAFGPRGEAYYSVIFRRTLAGPYLLNLYRSQDGGMTWSGPVEAAASRGIDRPFVVVDNTGGRFRGRVYVNGQASGPGLGGERHPREVTLYRSTDGGVSAGLSAKRVTPDTRSLLYPGNGVVLSDGTYLAAYNELRSPEDGGAPAETWTTPPRRPNGAVKVVASEDGGDSLTAAVTVSDSYGPWPPTHVSIFPYLASDPGSPHFKDRIYAVWPDVRSGRCEIMFSYSQDRGKTWTRPKTVNDDVPFGGGRRGPDDYLPVVAVNRRGVVGVMWYDRRESDDNLGWGVRFTASLDGGDTFLPSVPVSEQPMLQERGRLGVGGQTLPWAQASGNPIQFGFWFDAFTFSGGHTAGLAAGADGRFHPLWVDNRTGVRQVWTAGVEVAGGVTRNGTADLSGLDDLSPKAVVEFRNPSFDRVSGLLTAEASLKNISDSTLGVPLKVRVLTVSSDLAERVEIANADNSSPGPGAVWDFTGLVAAEC